MSTPTRQHSPSQGSLRRTFEMDKEGNVNLPQGPGLGVEVDEGKLREAMAKPAAVYKWPGQKLSDGSISDY